MVALAPLDAIAADSADRGGLVAEYCVACHSDSARTADLSLQGLDPTDVAANPSIWEKVLRKVASGEMPPDGVPAPTVAARSSFAADLERSLDAAAAANPNPGRMPAHRLNRSEYANAVRDLLDFEMDVSAMLPADDTGYGFDNIADVLSLSPTLLDRYMFAARRISQLAVGSSTAQPQRDIFVRDRETGFREAGHAPASRQDIPLGSAGGVALRYYFPKSGEYLVEARLDRGDSRTAYEHRESRIGVEAGMRVLTFSFPSGFARPENIRPVASANSPEPHPPLDIRLDGARLQLVDLPNLFQAVRDPVDCGRGTVGPQAPGDTPSRRRSSRADRRKAQRRVPAPGKSSSA